MNRTAIRENMPGIAGFTLFISMIALAYAISPLIDNAVFTFLIGFVDEHLYFLIILGLFFLLGWIFSDADPPLDIASPILYLAGAFMTAAFLFQLIDFIRYVTFLNVLWITLLALLVILLVVALESYLHVFTDLFAPKARRRREGPVYSVAQGYTSYFESEGFRRISARKESGFRLRKDKSWKRQSSQSPSPIDWKDLERKKR